MTVVEWSSGRCAGRQRANDVADGDNGCVRPAGGLGNITLVTRRRLSASQRQVGPLSGCRGEVGLAVKTLCCCSTRALAMATGVGGYRLRQCWFGVREGCEGKGENTVSDVVSAHDSLSRSGPGIRRGCCKLAAQRVWRCVCVALDAAAAWPRASTRT